MLLPLIIMLIPMIFPIALISVTLILSPHSLKDREKMSPFECGFDPLASARLPFSMRFFLLAVVFLVFDIEIVLLMPMIMINPSYMTTYTLIIFLLILIGGLLHEWNEGSLDWA